MTFTAPWLLAGLALLPALWWLLRAIPPAPRRLAFPAIRLLLALSSDRKTAARTPPWLLALRVLLAAVVILAAAHPVLRPVPAGPPSPLLLVIDNGWASAPAWSIRRAQAETLIAQTAKSGQAVAILPTAPPVDGGAPSLIGPIAASQASDALNALAPLPWATDRLNAGKALGALTPGWRIVWLTDGIDDGTAAGLANRLQDIGTLELVRPRPPVLLLAGLDRDGGKIVGRVRRSTTAGPAVLTLRAVDDAGRTLGRTELTFDAGQSEGRAALDLPTPLLNRARRVDIEGEPSSATTFLLDESWQRHRVGLADDTAAAVSPLLDDLYYSERALTPLAEIVRQSLTDLLEARLSLIVLPDRGALDDTDAAAAKAWIEQGGVLVRLAGPKFADNPDDLLPVPLRGGSRMLGGKMSWAEPMALAAMPEASPFAGLAVPADVKIRAQLLAEPGPDLQGTVWARLTDGTPLITGRALGKGWLVLIHTTVGPAWSDLGLSGLYPDLLGRLIGLSRGVAADAADHPLPPMRMLDGFARLVSPAGAALALAPGEAPVLGPRHPPGLYGAGGRRSLNVNDDGRAEQAIKPLAPPPGAAVRWLAESQPQRDLQAPLALGALALFLADLLATLWLRGALCFSGTAALLCLVVVATPTAGHAEADVELILKTRLAYVVTGDGGQDAISRLGLGALTAVVNHRTTAVLAEPQGVVLDRDDLVAYPLLYWPITDGQTVPDDEARTRLNRFLRHGGVILFDTRDRGQSGPTNLRRLTEGLDIPALTAVDDRHVLTRAFYLLEDLPGRFAGLPVYVADSADTANDGVSPVIVGGNDWAAAWAVDANGRRVVQDLAGGERQRELAYRFGVNLVMYALTGTYKSDQVHLPAILERMRR